MRVAAIDVGTNSVHLLVADIAPDGQRTIMHKARIQVMLGSGGLGAHRIADDAFERGLAALKRFALAAESLGVDDIHAAATSAVREADNGDAFCKAVKDATGIHVRVISGSDEARLIYLGARETLDFTHGQVMLCDLGGGSTEFVLADANGMLHTQSLPLGHIRLAEGFQHSDPLSADDRQTMKRHVRNELRRLTRRVPKGTVGTLVGSSGTLRCLARMTAAARGDTKLAHDHGLVLTRKEVEVLLDAFMETPSDRLHTLPGMDPRRSKTLPAGAVLIREIMKALGTPQLTTSELSLRDGLMVDWIIRNRKDIDLSRTEADPRRRSVLLAMQRYDVDQTHAEHVRRLALTLFDRTAAYHELPIADRELLGHTAMLHDIGHHIAGKSHHKHGQYLLRHIRMNGFTAPEIAVMSNVVRYHSRARPKPHHGDYTSLSSLDQRRVRVLAGLLKIADGLDRSHEQPVTEVEVVTGPGTIRVIAHCEDGAELERWASARRTALLAQELGRDIVVEVVQDSSPA